MYSDVKVDYQGAWRFTGDKGALLVMNQMQTTRFNPDVDIKWMIRGNDLFGSIRGSYLVTSVTTCKDYLKYVTRQSKRYRQPSRHY